MNNKIIRGLIRVMVWISAIKKQDWRTLRYNNYNVLVKYHGATYVVNPYVIEWWSSTGAWHARARDRQCGYSTDVPDPVATALLIWYNTNIDIDPNEYLIKLFGKNTNANN